MKHKNKRNLKHDSRKIIDIESQIKKVDVGVKNGVFIYTSPLTVEQFSQKIGIHANDVIKYFFIKGISSTINSMLTMEQIGELCLEYGLDFQIKKEITRENVLENLEFNDDPSAYIPRPPIVTIMGHVDHGKTTLLDSLRKSQLTKGEKGGITQHIGSYQVNYNGKLITFIDTPGHEAFTEMRARGANVTDIVILVVAADDGVMPQTEEAIDHAKQAKVPIIVFINKIDKPNVNVDLVLSQLAKKNLVAEEWDGDTVVVKGSALTGEGLDKLLENILAIGELNDLRANPQMLPYGVVLDANVTPSFGIQASVIVLQGTLMVGDQILIGSTRGKIRIIVDDNGKFIKSAKPSQPVKISGLEKLPNPGDKFVGVKDDKVTKKFVGKLSDNIDLSKKIQSNKTTSIADSKVVNLILKVDARGSLEAIQALLMKVKNAFVELEVNVVRVAIGAVSENDVRLAHVSGAVIIAFNLPTSKTIVDLANSLQISIRNYDVVYKLQDDLSIFLSNYLDPVYDEKILGEATVRQLWFHSKIGTIAGCLVTSGKVLRKSKCKVIRADKIIYQSSISSLRQGKENVNEVGSNIECGIVVENFNDIKVNDIIQSFELSIVQGKKT